jgi:hypothetical protein
MDKSVAEANSPKSLGSSGAHLRLHSYAVLQTERLVSISRRNETKAKE